MWRCGMLRHTSVGRTTASVARVQQLRTAASAVAPTAQLQTPSANPAEIKLEKQRATKNAEAEVSPPQPTAHATQEYNAVRPEMPLPPEELTRMPAKTQGLTLRLAEAVSATSLLASFSFECRACHATVDGPMRLVCPMCFAVRPNAPGLLKALLAQNRSGNVWYCARCHEVNLGNAARCRCCARSRVDSTDSAEGSETPSTSLGRAPPSVLPESLRRLFVNPHRTPNGEVFRHRDCFLRWRCPSCSNSNAHWDVVCRECDANRLTSTMGVCPTCRSQTHTLEDAVLKKACRGCRGSLHGMSSSSIPQSWLCTCATVSMGQTCLRCRAPKLFPQTPPTVMLRHATTAEQGIHDGRVEEQDGGTFVSTERTFGELEAPAPPSLAGPAVAWAWLQRWDFLDGSHWLCASCFEINLASRKIAVVDRDNTRRTSRSVPGQHSCSRCGVLWHGAMVDGGSSWRCACHNLNPTSRESCSDCGLPFKLGSVTAISTWMPRDWLCAVCGHHNYKSRVECSRCKHPRGKRHQ